jgi:hypothetical protein
MKDLVSQAFSDDMDVNEPENSTVPKEIAESDIAQPDIEITGSKQCHKRGIPKVK